MIICDKCSANIINGAKFCHQCGNVIGRKNKKTISAKPRLPAKVEIIFGYSSSLNYDAAVKLCQKIPTYKTKGNDKKARHYVKLFITDVELIISIYDLVGNWKSSKMLINGEPSTRKHLTMGAMSCYMARQRAHNPQASCYGTSWKDMNLWGCTRLNMPINEWHSGWLEYGHFDEEEQGAWKLDKKKIWAELEKEIARNKLCPALNRLKVFNTLKGIPTKINPEHNHRWKYKLENRFINGEWRQVAIGIVPVLKNSSYYILDDVNPQWEYAEETQESTILEVIKPHPAQAIKKKSILSRLFGN